ncbi:cutinase family protein [Actinoplanes sp. NBRC 101535]|uniref:cutinase family protein n=1 Tax=Actinoplanes sp. NBRC 101535 TaxID=3032196 RepID=UPI0024A3F0ED|nr:cutinase family protein [Actinoplanes sp. NBRC 101535]GLX99896.1 cutinase [Actinoplanes sp. NBRC 101535]
MRKRKMATLVAAGAVTVGGLAVAPLTFAAEAPRNECADVQLLGARGTTERPGFGVLIGPLADRIVSDLPQTVRATPVDYPANFNYNASVRQGVTDLTEKMEDTAAACPQTTFVLAGYSQGADVVGDAITGELSDELVGKISSVILFGDPTFTAGEDFNVTDGNRSGIFARRAGSLDAVADRTRSFCNRNDRFCQGGTSLAAHLDYNKFIQQATDFAAENAG